MYNKCFDPAEIKRVFKIECFQKDEEVFEKTHYGLNLAFKDPQVAETFMMEDALAESQWSSGLKERRRSGDYIRPYIIWGAPGTGKTELCRWLEINIPKVNSDYETKRITKRVLAMGGILGVAQSLSNQDIDLGKKLTVRYAGVGVEDWVMWVIGAMMDDGKVTIESGDRDQVLRMIATTVRNNIEKRVKLIEEADDVSKIETSLEFITNQDLKQSFSYYGIDMDTTRVNREIYHALTNFLANVRDVKKLIFDFVKTKNNEGKIPVLIFDDVTHLGDLVDEFVSVLTDISGGEEGYVCDFVIGTTTDFYFQKFKDVLASTARARTFEIKLSPEESHDLQNANWLLGENGLKYFLEFVLRYLNASRKCEDCQDCAQSPFVEKRHNYYPFTKTFLVNLYARLLREKDEPIARGVVVSITPRFIIQVLRNTLGKFTETSEPPSRFVDESLIFETLDFFALDAKEKEANREFLQELWWYGTHSEDGSSVSIEKDTLQKLKPEVQIPQSYLRKKTIVVELIPLKGISPPTGSAEPEAYDEASLRAHIRRWCKDEGSQISLTPIVNGFNQVIACMERMLSGSNNFRNIMNYRSSREGEAIEFQPPGQKKCYFWVGELKGDDSQIYLMSKYKTESLKPFADKGFLILFLDEDDFFRLYKIGADTTAESDRPNYLRDFLTSKRDEVFQTLWNQRVMLKDKLEKELGCSAESFALSAYLLMNRLLKSEANLSRIENAEDIKRLVTYEQDLSVIDWPANLSFPIGQLSKYFESVKDLFYSFYSLRGEGSVIDYPILDSTWSQIQNEPYQVIKNAGRVDDRFTLSKRKSSLENFSSYLKDLLRRVESYSQGYVETDVKNDINHMRELLNQICNKEQLLVSARALEHVLDEQRGFELRGMINELVALQGVDEHLKDMKMLQTQISNAQDSIQRAGLLASLNKIRRHSSIQLVRNLAAFIERLEDETGSSAEVNVANLREEFRKFLKLEEEL